MGWPWVESHQSEAFRYRFTQKSDTISLWCVYIRVKHFVRSIKVLVQKCLRLSVSNVEPLYFSCSELVAHLMIWLRSTFAS